MSKISLYLAGPMRGYENDNRDEFLRIAVMLRAEGHLVFNPGENDIPGGTFEDFMAKDLAELAKLDGVAVLKGWEKSQGANIEVMVARMMNKPVFDAYTMQPMVDSRKPTNPKDVAAVGKLDFSLVPGPAVAYLALALTEGDYKYGGYNYRVGGVLSSVYMAALDRHKFKYQSGEWEDEKTKVPHLASMMACCGIMIDAHELGVLVDDRPPAFDMAELIDRLSKITGHLKTLWPDSPGRFTETNKTERTK